MSGFSFVLNGEVVRVEGEPTHTTLLQYLRKTGRTGTKEGCAEGDCGACTVALVEENARGERTYRAINSCIALLPMFAGREVVTVEGLRRGGVLHPVQDAMVRHYGSQCGYCTPGFVLSMFEGYYREDLATDAQIVDQLNGNLCRCTGYRPIRDAMKDALASRPDKSAPDVFQLRLKKGSGATPALDYAEGGDRFVRPTSTDELLRILAEHPDAELVAGATELGVFVNKRSAHYPLLISTEGVAELRRVKKVDGAWHVGGAVTLTALEEALGGAIPALDKMLWVFASRPIRSRATLAGNLVTASPIGDMAPVMLALGAEVVLASARGRRTLPLSDFFVDYRKTALAKDEILEWVVIPPAPAGARRIAQTYKVSKRRELDIAIVSAGLVVDLDAAGNVQDARFGWGGVAKMPVRSTKTEDFLRGKPWTKATVDAACAVLEAEFSPIDDVRSGKAYRQGLTSALLAKLFSGDESLGQDRPLVFQKGRPTEAPDPSRALAHESGALHVTGEALYVDDVAARRSDMLEIWPVTSPHARARITAVDTSAAERIPGVVRVLTAKDVPGANDVGAVRHDEPLFADGEVRFHGHIVAIVVGETLGACRAGAAAVKVDYEPLPAVLSIEAAMRADSYHTSASVIARGDVDAALDAAPHRLKGTLDIGGQEHFYLESHAAWATYTDDDGFFVSSSTQHPTEVQAIVSHVMNVPRNRVVVQAPRMGGGFGGKETQGNTWAAIVALAAEKTRRGVRVQLDRDVDMMLTGKRHPIHARYDVGYDDAGKLLAVKASLVSDGGWALDLSESILDRALFHIDNAYYVPALRVEGRVAKTNNVSHTAFRGFGGPQGMVVIEEIVDRVARTLGRRPEAVREVNLYRGAGETNTTHYGQELGDERIPAIFAALAAKTELAARRAAIAEANAKSVRIKRGIALTPVKFGISFTATWLNQAGALVLVYRDGTAQVNHGGTEMGQGLYTKVRGVVMRELGLSEGRVRVMKTQTDKVPNTSATAASSGSDLNGQAARVACETLRERLAPVAAALLAEASGSPVDPAAVTFAGDHAHAGGASVPFEKVAERAYATQVQLSATGFYKTPGIGWDKAKGKGKPFYYFAYGAAVAEVEVDGWTGMKRVVRVDVLQDVGDSLNPGVDRGQIEGAFVQGMGWLTGEELKWDASGRLLSHSASTYQIPSIGDAPEVFEVELLPRAHQPGVIHGSKAVGEPPLMLAISVREAIRDAVAAFGDAPGPVDLPSPATHEAIFHAVEARRGRGARAAE